MPSEEQLNVTVERVLYPPETTEGADWFILATQRHGVVKGNMSWRPKEGERLKITGKYGSYQGKREFKFTVAALDIPTDPRGMLHYVCEIASGVGPALETQIWESKGEAWATVKDGEIPRLQGHIFDNFMEAIQRVEGDRAKGQVIADLLAAGCTMNMATAAYEEWGESTLGVVSNDPYRLAELSNFGFQHVDGVIRQHYGIMDDDPKRIRAAVIYVLRQMTGSGSTLVPWEELEKQCIAKLSGFRELILQAVDSMFQEGTLRGFKASKHVALAKDYRNEQAVWEFIEKGADW